MATKTFENVRRLLAARLEQMTEIGEGSPQGVGVDHIELERVGKNAPVADIADTLASDAEWERLRRDDTPARETCARILTIKEACSKALGTGISEELAWTDLEIPRVSARPFRVRFSRFSRRNLYAISGVADERAFAAAAVFERQSS